MQVLSDSSTGTGDGSTTGTQDCAVTGGKGNYIDSGSTNMQGVPVNWIVHECQIEVKVAGQRSVILTRTSTSVSGTINLSYVARVNFIVYVQNKTLWINVEHQHKNLVGKWLKTFGVKTKLGSWASLKF
ncbi:hypothetical protein [Bacillus proteolyticus]|uniref:hypothetical protein n=1 Tax=Bacillus proteolyticus TaxID=2026192 RepID=UPI002E23F6FA|nr:hypothetical protein [Bacillus proteolyticus]